MSFLAPTAPHYVLHIHTFAQLVQLCRGRRNNTNPRPFARLVDPVGNTVDTRYFVSLGPFTRLLLGSTRSFSITAKRRSRGKPASSSHSTRDSSKPGTSAAPHFAELTWRSLLGVRRRERQQPPFGSRVLGHLKLHIEKPHRASGWFSHRQRNSSHTSST